MITKVKNELIIIVIIELYSSNPRDDDDVAGEELGAT